MNQRLLALLLLSSATAMAQSATADEPAPSEMPSNLTFDTDLYFVEPKLTLSFGARGLSGTKSSFRGSGKLESSLDVNGPAGTMRTYHDGAVGPDTRSNTIDNGDGTTTSEPIAPDGKTDNWRFDSDKQAVDPGIAMHTYQAEILDTGPKNKDPGSTYGLEVSVARDMGKIFRFDWNVIAGLSINDINSKLTSTQQARITTLTDLYSLNGQAPPPAPYNSQAPPTPETITNPDGTTTDVTTDTTTLLPTDYLGRDVTTVTDTTNVTNHFSLKGAYFTLRAGPTLILPLGRFHATVSAGAAIVYAGTTYSVQQDFQPETGSLITLTEQNSDTKLLPGFYADANLEFWLTERSGLYLGALYQNSGSFTQNLTTIASNYSTKVDLTSLTGFKMGMNVRF